MRIAFLSTDFKPNDGGVAELSWRVCEELSGHGCHVTVFTNRHPQEPDQTQLDAVHVQRVFDPPAGGQPLWRRLLARPAWVRRTRAALDAAVRAHQPDAVLAGNYTLLWDQLLTRGHWPFFIYLHGEDVTGATRARNPMRTWEARRVLRAADHSFWNSRWSLSEAERLCGGPLPHASVTNCGFPPERIVKQPDRAGARQRLGWGDEPVLLTVARLIDRKGVDMVLAALPTIRAQFPNCRHAIIGQGPDRPRLEQLVRDRDLIDAVMFLGFVDDQTKWDAYAASDLYVMTPRKGRYGEVEGFGIVYLEANAHGLAVVGGTEGGVSDAVADGETGLLVNPHQPDAIAAAVIELLSDAERRAAMAQRGQARIRERFNWRSITARMLADMRGVVERTGRAATESRV